MRTDSTIAIVGAGPGGLAAAMLLQAQGYRVRVFEKQPRIGGRTSSLRLGEYSFDRGPTFLMMPALFLELFASVGRSLDDYVDLVRIDPLYRLQFGSVRFEPSTDQDRTAMEIERLFPGESAGYRAFMREEKAKYERVLPLLRRPFLRAADYARMDVLRALPKLHLRTSVYDRLSTYFRDERLKYAFAFQAKYLGMSPWTCPGTFTILSYIEHAYGLWHPIGGVNRICEAMAQVFKELGGELTLDAGVERVLSRSGKAVGIKLSSGETIEADHVVVNADYGYAVRRLFEPDQLHKHRSERVAKKKLSCSTFMLYLGVKRRINLPHHTVMFADDYKVNVAEMTQGRLSPDSSLYVHNPSAIDPTLAPQGKSSLYVLVPVPNLDGDPDWSDASTIADMRQRVLERLEREPELRGLSADIEAERIITPLDWEQSHDVYRGAAFNLAHSVDQMMMLRPQNRFEDLANCWLVGGGTHPGSGLPTIIESARISAGLIQKQDAALIGRGAR